MRSHFLICCVWLTATAGLAQDTPSAEVYPFGTIDLRFHETGGRGLEINKQRRGDGPFSHLQVNLFTDIAVGDDLIIFNQITLDPSSRSSPSSFLRTWAQWRLYSSRHGDVQLQLGKIPTPFGNYTERAYTDKNPLIGHPLMYHYFTSLRSNQLPADNGDLLDHRGSGSGDFGGYEGGGASSPRSGLPLIYDTCWDFGGGLIGSLWRLEYLFAITQGTLSDPRSGTVDTNDGQQIAARIGLVPFTGAMLRLSWARGPYLDRVVASSLPTGAQVEDYEQEIVGLAAEYEIRHLVIVAEAARNRWTSPYITNAGGHDQDLEVDGAYVEVRQKLGPGFHAAARWSALRFARIDDGTGRNRQVRWDRSVDRLEMSLTYWLNEMTLIKSGVQLNDLHAQDGDDHLATTQLTVRF